MKNILYLLFLVSVISCKDAVVDIETDCDQAVKIDVKAYESIDYDIVIDSLSITSDCLNIRFSASGCDGSSWILELIDSEAILESYPPQRNMKLLIENDELCDAWITREMTFDISQLQVEDGPVWLNIMNSALTDMRILYEYSQL